MLIKWGKIITLFIQVTDFFIETNLFVLILLEISLKWIQLPSKPEQTPCVYSQKCEVIC